MYGRETFQREFVEAFLIHIALVVCILVIGQASIFQSKLSEQEVEHKLIQSAVRVDVVGMPDLTLQELKKIEESLSRVEDEKPKEEVQPVPTQEAKEEQERFLVKKRKNDLKSILERYQQKKLPLKNARTKRKRENVNLDFDAQDIKKLKLLGNKVQEGTRLHGEATSAEVERELALYSDKLREKIKPFWKLPSFLKEQKLRALIQVHISQNGDLLKSKIFESSGNDDYDQIALNAVKEAAPFMQPPDVVWLKVAGGELLLGFPL